jgi:hypothetical protein
MAARTGRLILHTVQLSVAGLFERSGVLVERLISPLRCDLNRRPVHTDAGGRFERPAG